MFLLLPQVYPSKLTLSNSETIYAFLYLAILGILVMNIQGYSMIDAAYMNPTAYGDFTGLNRWVWILSYLFAQLKFVTIFSLLFGAGILLFTGRIEARGHSSQKLHYAGCFGYY